MHKTGFVFGKFYPPHRGHLDLIEFASSQCEQLIVLICCSNQETIAPQIRAGWFADYASNAAIEFRTVVYDEAEYPNSSESSRTISRKWSELFRTLVPTATLLVTGETYGDYVAEYMGIEHVASQRPRAVDRVSATRLRNDLLGHWQWLVPGARRWFQKTIVIAGTESTGKSTLARRLAQKFGGALVEEAGRDIVPDSNAYSLQQLHEIATCHAQNIIAARASGAPVVIVDTDVYTTQSYAWFAFERYLAMPSSVEAANAADLRLYLAADAPYHQDGTRLDENRRNALDHCHRATLRHFKQACVELTGTYEQREELATQAIRKLFDVRWRK